MLTTRLRRAWGPESTLDTLMICFVAGLFGFAAIDKLVHAPGFVRAIDSYTILPIPMGDTLAPVVIAAELVIAVGLVCHPWRRLSALLGAVLMTIFTVALVANMMSGAEGICGCWFSVNMGQGSSHFILNGVLIGMSLLIACAPGRAMGESVSGSRSSESALRDSIRYRHP